MKTETKTRVTTPSDREIRCERMFDAPREAVWRAFTEPALLSRWWGRGNPLEVEALEVRKGGPWRFVESADGLRHGFEGRFREVEPPERLVQSFEWNGMPGHVLINTTTFDELDGRRTRVVTTSLFHTRDERDGMLDSGMATGLEQSYQALDRVLESEASAEARPDPA